MNLKNLVDAHIHGGPSHAPRKLLDHEVAIEAAKAGMSAIVLKSHEGSTVERAVIAQAVVNDKIKVFGGIALNRFIGGLNPLAVYSSILQGGKIVWMPTFTAKNHLDFERKKGRQTTQLSLVCKNIDGDSILDSTGKLLPAVLEILDMVAEADIVLSLGHLSLEEKKALVPVARQRKVRKIVLSHPEFPGTLVPASQQKWFTDQGVFIEHCIVNVIDGRIDWKKLSEDIHATGVENNYITTDLGQKHNPSPVEGLQLACNNLLNSGFSEDELFRMMSVTPKFLLGIA